MVTSIAKIRCPGLRDGLFAVRGTLVCSLIVLIFDVIVDGSYVISAIVCPIWFIVAIALAIGRRPTWRVACTRVLIPLVTALLAVANYSLQYRIAMGNAVRLIQACEQYRTANKGYPDTLNDLIPRYLSSVPRAKYCLSFGEFRYVASSQHMLIWCDIPPFGRRVYNLDAGTWKYLN
jgi:hypothetical protein